MRSKALTSDFPDGFLRDVFRGVVLSYETAHDILTQQFDHEGEDEPEFRNALPWLRRSLVEQALRIAAVKHSPTVQVTPERSGGFWWHRRVECGRVQLTQSTHDDVGKPLRPARYKDDYAKQQMLFEKHEVGADGAMYAVLLHHGAWRSYAPDFVVIKFPDSDLSWHPEVIDLTAEFTDCAVATDVQVEEVADLAAPVLRRRQANG